MPERVLVTGATGVIGRFVVPALLAAGYVVRGHYMRQPGHLGGVEWQQWDFREDGSLLPLLEGCDAVVHLAASLSDVTTMDRLNVAVPRALAAAAQAAGVRYFGHASSIVVYGSPLRREVSEASPLIDPTRPIAGQYHAEPYMLEYARTKRLGEQALHDVQPAMCVDVYRPAVVVELGDMLQSADWSRARKIGALYRRTQYIYAADAVAAILHLLRRGLDSARRGIEAYNVADHECGTFRQLHAEAWRQTGDARFHVPFDLPVVLDFGKDLVRHPGWPPRYPLGMLKVSNARLRATGFHFPMGFKAALAEALAARRSQPLSGPSTARL